MMVKHLAVFLALGGLVAASASAQSASDEIAKYRAMLADGNRAELVEAQGEALWATARGPNNVSLQKCDLGMGAGVVKGAYAELPRYFKDANAVMDAESRIVHCMVTLQGFDHEEVVKKPFSEQGERATDLEALTAYVVGLSRGSKINVPQLHADEKAA